MTMTRSTKVSRKSPAIRAILERCFPAYDGRKIKVVEGHRELTLYLPDDGTRTDACLYSFCSGGVARAHVGWSTPSTVVVTDREHAVVTWDRYCGTDCTVVVTDREHAVVTWDRYCGTDCGITIYVESYEDMFAMYDVTGQRAVAVDALLQGAPRWQVCALLNTFAGEWGNYERETRYSRYDRVTPLDLYLLTVEAEAATLSKSERRAVAA